jgi:hypothetical protein
MSCSAGCVAAWVLVDGFRSVPIKNWAMTSGSRDSAKSCKVFLLDSKRAAIHFLVVEKIPEPEVR